MHVLNGVDSAVAPRSSVRLDDDIQIVEFVRVELRVAAGSHEEHVQLQRQRAQVLRAVHRASSLRMQRCKRIAIPCLLWNSTMVAFLKADEFVDAERRHLAVIGKAVLYSVWATKS